MSEKEAVFAGQGTRLSETAPWESWDDEMDLDFGEDMEAAIAEYAQNRYADKQTSSESQEVLAEWKENNDYAAKEYQWLDPAEYEDEAARVGRVMHHNEFITTLRDKAGLTCNLRMHPHPDKAVLWYEHGPIMEQGPWIQLGNVPELSMMRFDDHGVPLGEKRRGWRTPLLQLILKGALTEKVAHKAFGPPKQTPAWKRYNQTLFEFRKRKYEVI